MHITFLGLGPMGIAVATRLLEAGHALTVWNRTPAPAKALAARGARHASSPAEAASEAEVVFTMLHDDEAVRSVMWAGGVLAALPTGAAHVSLSTISPALARELDLAHGEHGQRYLAAPVFGRPGVAAEGKLWLAVAGPAALLGQLAPVLETFSRGRTVVGAEPAAAHALKLAGNFLITATIASWSEAFQVAERDGVAPELLLEAVNDALFQSTWLRNYGSYMLRPPDPVTASVTLGAKDMRLFREAAATAGLQAPLAALFSSLLAGAVEDGLGQADWAGGLHRSMQIRGRNKE
jgi:3-hydroxyisobutyrate dehydrogenase-like beta-hydroxyacid dehydrogenase